MKYAFSFFILICAIQQLESQNFEEIQSLIREDISAIYPGEFGSSVSIKDKTLVVGAPLGGKHGQSPSGIVIIYKLDQTTNDWTEVKRLIPKDAETGDQFGESVFIGDNLVVVGAPGNNKGGSVYVFVNTHVDSNNWEQVEKLSPNTLDSGDRFGKSVGLSGSSILVGAPGSGDNNEGSVYVFNRINEKTKHWEYASELKAQEEISGRFGSSIAVNEDMIIIGAPFKYGSSKSGSAYIYTKSLNTHSEWSLVSKLMPDSSDNEDKFGFSVSLCPQLAIVGSPSSNTAYIFSKNSDTWDQISKIKPNNSKTRSSFGQSVSISNNFAVVGASSFKKDGLDIGSVYLFSKEKDSASIWNQTSEIINANSPLDRSFGRSLSMHNNLLLVGSSRDELAGNCRGSASLFSLYDKGHEYRQLKKWYGGEAGSYDRFGVGVSINNNLAIVGAPNDDALNGSAYVFSRESETGQWSQEAKLCGPSESKINFFGGHVSISGNNAVVTGTLSDEKNRSKGCAFIFSKNSTTKEWTQTAQLIPENSDISQRFGCSVSICGDMVVVGDVGTNYPNEGGVAYVFAKNSGGTNNWGQIAKLKPDVSTDFDYFGASISIFEEQVLIGAPGYGELNRTTGRAFLFAKNSGGTNNWGQVAELKSSNPQINASFGVSVSIHSERIIIGADTDNNFKGRAYVFTFRKSSAQWEEQDVLFDPYGVKGDKFGNSVSMIGDVALIGSPGVDEKGHNSGCAYIFTKQNVDNNDSWKFMTKFVGKNTSAFDGFGSHLDMNGSSLIIAAPSNKAGGYSSGSAYIFEKNFN